MNAVGCYGPRHLAHRNRAAGLNSDVRSCDHVPYGDGPLCIVGPLQTPCAGGSQSAASILLAMAANATARFRAMGVTRVQAHWTTQSGRRANPGPGLDSGVLRGSHPREPQGHDPCAAAARIIVVQLARARLPPSAALVRFTRTARESRRVLVRLRPIAAGARASAISRRTDASFLRNWLSHSATLLPCP